VADSLTESPLRVLHLEDSPRDAEIVRRKLEVDGVSCDIRLVGGKDDFETALAEKRFDLILLDHNLPGYDGITALKYAQRTRPDMPVILISGTVGDEEAVKCLHIGATDYLLKDRLDRLAPAVHRAIEEAETRRSRRVAEAALVDLRDALDQHALVAITDGRGIITFVNDLFCEVSGYSRLELLGNDHRMVSSGHHTKEFMRGLWSTITSGKIWRGEIENKAKDGSFYWLDVTIVPFLNDDGTPRQYMAIRTVITERKAAEQALRNERDRAQRYLDTAEVILLKLDLEGRVTLINRYGCAVLGWPAEELLGRDWVETCLPPRLRGALGKKFEALLLGDLAIVENAILTRSGEERLVEWRNSLLRDDDGQVSGTLSSGTDVTERNEAVEALRAAEERTQFVLQNAKVGVWDMDYTNGALRWSGTMEAQYGLPSGTFAGTFDAFVQMVHPDDRAVLLDTVGKAMATGSDFSVLNRAIWPDGTVRWLSGAGRILHDEGGNPVRGVGISLDVTERRILEQQFQQAQKMEAIGQLAGGVAHDFNNLLTVILGFCELSLADLAVDDPRRADIGEIQRAGTRAVGLTRQLLAFSRKQIIEPTRLDLNVVVADMQAMLRRLIREDVRVLLGLQPDLGAVMADRGEVEQVVMNLAVNARDAMPAGGTLTIETANVDIDAAYAKAHVEVTPGPYVVVTVTDTGTGMTPQVQARLFEPFFTTKEVGKGTGLGMASVYGIMTRSGGGVGVDSELGRGTAFKVYFPRASGEAVPADVPAPVAPPRAVTQTVLLVEDEEGLRELAKRLLLRQGYTVLVAADAVEAVQLFDANPSVDVLLTDVVMPDTSGPELVATLVARKPRLKVIYMSGYTDESIVHHGILNAGIAFLHKPFTSVTLADKLRDVLDR
jgi:two-component system cell cycle sensor histidine kinase/response regulator CckA